MLSKEDQAKLRKSQGCPVDSCDKCDLTLPCPATNPDINSLNDIPNYPNKETIFRFTLLDNGKVIKQYSGYNEIYSDFKQNHNELIGLIMSDKFVVYFDMIPLEYDITTKKLTSAGKEI